MTSFADSDSLPIIILCTIFTMPLPAATFCITQKQCVSPTNWNSQVCACTPPCSGAASLEIIAQSNTNSLNGGTATYICIGYMYSLQGVTTGDYECPTNTVPYDNAKSCVPGGDLFVQGTNYCPVASQLSGDACVCQGVSTMKKVLESLEWYFECVKYTGSIWNTSIGAYACPTGAKTDTANESCDCQDASYLVNNEGINSCQRYKNSNQDSATGYFHCPSSATRNDAKQECECASYYIFTGDDVDGWTCTACPVHDDGVGDIVYYC